MYVKEVFSLGDIFQTNSKTQADLDLDNCQIMDKRMNNKSIILHVKRKGDGKEANVFIRLKEEYKDNRPDFKKLLASSKVVGMSLNELRNSKVEDL